MSTQKPGLMFPATDAYSFFLCPMRVWHSLYLTATIGWANYLRLSGCLGFPEHHQATAWYQTPPALAGTLVTNNTLKYEKQEANPPLWDSLKFNSLISPPWGLLLVMKTVVMEFGWLWQRTAMNSMPVSNPVHATELLSQTWCAQGLAPLYQKDACKATSCSGTEEISSLIVNSWAKITPALNIHR